MTIFYGYSSSVSRVFLSMNRLQLLMVHTARVELLLSSRASSLCTARHQDSRATCQMGQGNHHLSVCLGYYKKQDKGIINIIMSMTWVKSSVIACVQPAVFPSSLGCRGQPTQWERLGFSCSLHLAYKSTMTPVWEVVNVFI